MVRAFITEEPLDIEPFASYGLQQTRDVDGGDRDVLNGRMSFTESVGYVPPQPLGFVGVGSLERHHKFPFLGESQVARHG